MKYEEYYKPKKETEKTRKAFQKMINLLDSVNAILLSEYNDANSIISYKINNIIIKSKYLKLDRQINTFVKLKEDLKKNNDEFIEFVRQEENSRFVSVVFKNIDDESINTVTINAYRNYVIGRERFRQEIINNNHECLSEYHGTDKKVKIKYECRHQPTEITPNSYISGQRCPICSNTKIVPYVNDFYTVHNELLQYFDNPELTIGIASSNNYNQKFSLHCPLCKIGHKNMTLDNIVANGFTCPYCASKVSYFNRFMYKLLIDLNEDFDNEVRFDWCVFDDYTKEKQVIGIYDFVIENKKLIIEMDGGLHIVDNSMNGKTKEESQYIDYMKDLLAKENGYKIIRIDCFYNHVNQRFDNLKKNILSSDLYKYYCFDNIDFESLNIKSLESDIKLSATYWNEGYGMREISDLIHKCIASTRSYLEIATTIGWCDYTKSEAKSRSRGKKIKVYQNNNLVGLFLSKSEACKQLKRKYNMPFDPDVIAKHLKEIINDYKGLKFSEIDNVEYRKLLQEKIYDIDINKLTYTNAY